MLREILVNGIVLGSIYVLIAAGFNMIFGVLKLMNFAHGELLMVGTFICFTFLKIPGLGLTTALFLTLVTAALGGVLFYYTAYASSQTARKNSDAIAPLLSSLGISIVLENVAQKLWGTETYPFPLAVKNVMISFGAFRISVLQLTIFAVSFAVAAALYLLIKFSRFGVAVRATSYNRVHAALSGISVRRTILCTFAAASALAALAGILIGIYYDSVYATMGNGIMVKAFAAAVLGGIGSIPGAMLGGIVLGLAECLTGAYISNAYVDGVPFIVVFLVLIFKPNGFFGELVHEKV